MKDEPEKWLCTCHKPEPDPERQKIERAMVQLGIQGETYFRGHLKCIGNRNVDLGRGETWEDALVQAYYADVVERMRKTVMANARLTVLLAMKVSE